MSQFYNPFSLENKTILITGASSGIGKITAIECSKLGAKLIITGRDEERLLSTLESLQGEGHIPIIADISQMEGLYQLVEELDTIDGCVNNAGINNPQLVSFIKPDNLEKMFKINVFAPILLTHLLVKKKRIKNGGSIVFTSSISANGAGSCAPGNSIYAATKGALISFMKNAAVDLSTKKIRLNAVLPGMVETPLKTNKKTVTQEQWDINLKQYPLGRFGNPEDVANGIIYFLSEASNWATGSTLIIDGGKSLI